MATELIDRRSWEAARLLASPEAETPGRLPREMVTQADHIRWTECGLQAGLWRYLEEGTMAAEWKKNSSGKSAKRKRRKHRAKMVA